MKYAVEMGFGVVYTKYHKVCFKYSGVMRRDTQTYKHHGNHIRLLLLIENKESRLKLQLKWVVAGRDSNRAYPE
jgi:hypothetical protein